MLLQGLPPFLILRAEVATSQAFPSSSTSKPGETPEPFIPSQELPPQMTLEELKGFIEDVKKITRAHIPKTSTKMWLGP